MIYYAFPTNALMVKAILAAQLLLFSYFGLNCPVFHDNASTQSFQA